MLEKKWEASYPVKNPEHINTRTKLPPLPFQASYEEDEEVNFFWLISHEYQRIWLEEQKKWETMTYQSKEQQSKFMRKSVNPRLRPRRYATPPPIEFKIKRFENIPGKTDTFHRDLKRAVCVEGKTKPK
ncbi:uncharacterized protein LOC123291056 isoform X2 [Chrysoperla carnea]|uniref:uncharacterized protein LOC123291056 isoform X2 n=1 Tax=Chrysoperla carnea TaxID=189513 RepID=UPI001D05D28D|nr:uncharacterized protein LOC123291056 isoform X2 [Chrysoperla carnea]